MSLRAQVLMQYWESLYDTLLVHVCTIGWPKITIPTFPCCITAIYDLWRLHPFPLHNGEVRTYRPWLLTAIKHTVALLLSVRHVETIQLDSRALSGHYVHQTPSKDFIHLPLPPKSPQFVHDAVPTMLAVLDTGS